MNYSYLHQDKTPLNIRRSWENADNFETTFKQFFSKNDMQGLISFLESFCNTYPLKRDLIRQAHNQVAEIGLTSLADECARIYVETCSTLLKVGKKELGLPTIFEFYHRNGIKSELVNQAALTKMLLQIKALPIKPVFPLSMKLQTDFILAFQPYLADCFEILSESSSQVELFSSLSKFAPYAPIFYKFSDTQYGHNSNFVIDCHKNLMEKKVNPYPFQLKDVTIDKALKFLKPYGILPNDDFVVLYVGEEEYLNTFTQIADNAYAKQFVSTVDFFLQQGFKVVRLGHFRMKQMMDRPGFIDLTKIQKPEEVEIFLCGRAKFYFGTRSGPIDLAYNFGTPCFEIARIDYFGLKTNHFAQYIIFEDAQTKYKYKFSDLVELGLQSQTNIEPFLTKQLAPCLPTSQDNLNFAKESLDYLFKGKIFHLNATYKSEREQHKVWGGLSAQVLPLLK